MAHILVVDDDASIQDLIKDVLAMQSHTVDAASSASEALKKIRAARYDLAIVDRTMPEMDGLQLVKVLRSAAATKDLKVLMCTAKDLMVDAEEAFAAGANDYIVKPLDFAKLAAKVALLTKKA
ncbi:MAG: response regulator transcription factor [Elusimicrobiota bacterium]